MTDQPKETCPVDYPDCALPTVIAQLQQANRDLTLQLGTDPLTGLFNHRHFRDSLDKELERTLRTGQPMALIMLDLDHFKQVNDRWGHEVGNLALRHAADCMRESTRRIDILCRYGGEEFAVLAPGTGLSGAVRVAERLRSLLDTSPLTHDAGILHLTASLGVAIHTVHRALSADQLVRQADSYLYQAKHGGRNRIAHPPLESASPSQVTADEKTALLG